MATKEPKKEQKGGKEKGKGSKKREAQPQVQVEHSGKDLLLFLGFFRCHYLFPRSAHAGDWFPVLDADALFGSATFQARHVSVEPGVHSGRLARLGVEQHDVR